MKKITPKQQRKIENVLLLLLFIIVCIVAMRACREEYKKGYFEYPVEQDTDSEQLEDLRVHHPNAVLFE